MEDDRIDVVSDGPPSKRARLTSASSSSHNSSTGESAVRGQPEKAQKIQQQLVLLLHAHKCRKREQQNSPESVICYLPNCQTMKGVLRHIIGCTERRACKVLHCVSSRQIITHWKKCKSKDCEVCAPLKQAAPHNPDVQGQQQRSTLPAVFWHFTIQPDSREQAVQRLVQAIFPSRGPKRLRDRLVQYAKVVEADIFHTADTKEHYHYRLAQKTNTIQMDLEQKRREVRRLTELHIFRQEHQQGLRRI